MKDKYESGYIPTQLDRPMRILMWDYDQVLVAALPFMVVGLWMKQFILSIVLSYVVGKLYSRMKTSSHPKFIYHFVYWYLPSWMHFKKLRCLSDSSKRNLNG